jgi:tetratricopeptide (TPR) repeat protein
MLQPMFDAISRLWRRSARRVHGLFHSISEWIPDFIRPAFWIFLVLYPFRAVVSVWRERAWRNLIWGMPAIIGLLVLGALAIRGQQAEGQLPKWYWDDSQVALANGDYVKAEMLLIRLLQMRKGYVEEARFSLATLYRETGSIDQADLLFRSLAPDDAVGNRLAHKQRAIDLCEQLVPDSSAEMLARALHHLEIAADKESPEMLLAWGRYEIAQENWPAARTFLEEAVKAFPEAWAPLGNLKAAMKAEGEEIPEEDIVRTFLKAESFLGNKFKGAPDDAETRQDFAVVLFRLGKFDEAKQVIEEGIRREPDGRWKSLMANFYVSYHDILSEEGNHGADELLQMLSAALSYDPNCTPALARLMKLMSPVAEENAKLRAILNQLVATGKNPGPAHLALGNMSCIENDFRTARIHFEMAISHDQHLVAVLNNLAWLLATEEENPDLNRALELVNKAIEAEPKNTQFLDTRGTIYMLMERWEDALADLGQVNSSNPERNVEKSVKSETHRKLAKIYDSLGISDLAEVHRKQAE